MAALTIREIEGDLFNASKDYALAHCVASDLRMGAGIAVQFKNRFGQVANLKAQNVSTGGVAILKHDDRFIYYLVTKASTYQKPTYANLFSSLEKMKEHMKKNGVTKLAIPYIGCGLDGLQWNKVKDLLMETFKNESIEIVVYSYKPK